MSEHFAVKRITSELSELQKNPSPNFLALPIENDLFDWHFTLKGPKDTVYENGLYHGRLILPLNYPLKPPKFLMYNQSGRFEVGREICMSNTSFHPDEWQPAWTIRTILEGLISFFPEETEGAIGAIKASEETRKALAVNSWNWSCANCGKLAEIWKNYLDSLGIECCNPKDIIVEDNQKKIENSEEKKIEEIKESVEERKREEEKEKENRFAHLPSEDEVKKFVGHINSRLTAIEFFIVALITFVVSSQFIEINLIKFY